QPIIDQSASPVGGAILRTPRARDSLFPNITKVGVWVRIRTAGDPPSSVALHVAPPQPSGSDLALRSFPPQPYGSERPPALRVRGTPGSERPPGQSDPPPSFTATSSTAANTPSPFPPQPYGSERPSSLLHRHQQHRSRHPVSSSLALRSFPFRSPTGPSDPPPGQSDPPLSFTATSSTAANTPSPFPPQPYGSERPPGSERPSSLLHRHQQHRRQHPVSSSLALRSFPSAALRVRATPRGVRGEEDALEYGDEVLVYDDKDHEEVNGQLTWSSLPYRGNRRADEAAEAVSSSSGGPTAHAAAHARDIESAFRL
ncbi:hypothetical protein JOQ06_007398, partial [Pogonophryne albipinna]